MIGKKVYRNVWITKMDTQPVESLIIWINATIECDVKELSELCTGAIYCQLLHRMCRRAISLARVRLYTNEPRDFESNYAILRGGFNRIGLNKEMRIKQLMAGRGHFDFINWFYKFFNANRSLVEYHPKLERKQSLIGLRPKIQRAQLERRHSCFDYGYKQAKTPINVYRARSLLMIPTNRGITKPNSTYTSINTNTSNRNSTNSHTGIVNKMCENRGLENSTVVVEPIQMQKELQARKQINEIVEKYESVKKMTKNSRDTMKAMQKINNLINSTVLGLNKNMPNKYKKVYNILIKLTDRIARALLRINETVNPKVKRTKSKRKLRPIYNRNITSTKPSLILKPRVYKYWQSNRSGSWRRKQMNVSENNFN